MKPETNHKTAADDNLLQDRPPEEGVRTSPLAMPLTYRYLDLSRSGAEILIEYEGQVYRLRTTRNGKLILNK